MHQDVTKVVVTADPGNSPERPGLGDASMVKRHPFSNIREDVRELLEGEGRRLEAVEYVAGRQAFTVITYRLDYRDWPSFESPPGVIKLSVKEHAIADSTHIQIGSSRYYREYEGDTQGVADPEEARLAQRSSLSEFLQTNGLSPRPGYEHVSSAATWARPDFLMFCTSLAAEGRDFRALRSQLPDYDCATLIPDPSAFAMQLGIDIGRQFDLENVRLSGFDKLKRIMLSQAQVTVDGRFLKRGLDTTVLVSHGPVTYCDPPERVVNRFPIERRGIAVPFVKRSKFAGQREYRFVVEVIGEPEEKVFLMEISDELRSLVHTLK